MVDVPAHIALGGLEVMDRQGETQLPRWIRLPHASHRERIQLYTFGQGSLVLDNNRYPIQPGVGILYKRGLMQSGESDKGFRFIQVFFDLYAYDRVPLLQWSPDPVCIKGRSFGAARRIAAELTKTAPDAEMSRLLRRNAQFLELLAVFFEAPPKDRIQPRRAQRAGRQSAASRDDQTVREVIRFIDDNLARSMTRKNLAQAAGITPRHLDHVFNRIMNTTALRFVEDMRILKAKELLSGRQALIREVAEAVGYDDPYHFSRVFKKHTGYPPSLFVEARR